MREPAKFSDPWSSLRKFTAARIALGRAGSSLPTKEVLNFAAAHARARDAVHEELDLDALACELERLGLTCVLLSTAASNRQLYLQRPDLGRRLDQASHDRLQKTAHGVVDLAITVADGLSAPGATLSSAVLRALAPKLRAEQISHSAIFLLRQGRVAIQDEIGAAVQARLSLILLGERPGLSASESLGAYLVHDPRVGRTDADRNCVSNIRDGGLSAEAAADTLHYLILQSLRRGISGVALKDDRPRRKQMETSSPTHEFHLP